MSDQLYVQLPQKTVVRRDQVCVTDATNCAGITSHRDQVYVGSFVTEGLLFDLRFGA